MKKLLLETSFSKVYMIVMIIITLLILGGYFSYAMFTVTKEKSNAISIVTGNLTYKLEVDGEEGNTLTVPANSRKDFIVTLSNPNNRVGRFNFYYVGGLPDGVDIGYIEKEGVNTPPSSTGINLEKVDTTGSSNTYIVRVANTTGSEISIELGVSVGLDYNDLELPSNGHLLRKITSTGTVSEVIEDDIMNRLNYEDTEQTFVTGSNPYNYIWYSGKLWRVVSIDPSDNSVKLVTQWNISTINYGSKNFKESYMEKWLNDTTADGFLGNLRSPESFIKMDSKWNASMMSNTSKPPSESEGGVTVEEAVGLLNIYEYTMSGNSTSYLSNGFYWWTITPAESYTDIYRVQENILKVDVTSAAYGIRPSVNLKPEIKVISGNGAKDNPYRLMGDNDTNLEETKLSTRYSGEYISFGTGENNLYRIVSHETEGLTKITSVDTVSSQINFDKNGRVNYSKETTIGQFLNGEYLTSGKYITEEQTNMIEDNTTWYMGKVAFGEGYYLAKYTDENRNELISNTSQASVGLLRTGELMATPILNRNYWMITPSSNSGFFMVINEMSTSGYLQHRNVLNASYVRPSLNLKENVIITSGDGTLQNPFEIELAS